MQELLFGIGNQGRLLFKRGLSRALPCGRSSRCKGPGVRKSLPGSQECGEASKYLELSEKKKEKGKNGLES